MDNQSTAGIYIKKDKAVAVVHQVGKTAKKLKMISVARKPDDDQATIAGLLWGKLKEEKINPANFSMAADCEYYIQHKLHSQFTDHRQIAQTIKFDAEEVLATDILQKAVAFEVNKSSATGSDVTIYSAERAVLADVLSDFRTNKIDPVAIEPDIVCLTRFIKSKMAKSADVKDCVFVLISNEKCYMINFDPEMSKPLSRTFLTNQTDDKTKLLQRQIPMTLAGFSRELEGLKVMLVDTTGSVDLARLGSILGIEIESSSLAQYLPQIPDDVDTLDAAVACGSRVMATEKNLVDFRKDFSPYLGRRQAIEKTLKFMAIFVSVVLLAVAVYFQIEVLKKADNVKKAEKKLFNQAVMILPKRKLETTRETTVSLLQREIVRLNDQKSGQLTLEAGSIEAKLNFVFQAINSTPGNLDLNIETIDVSQRSIRIIGDTDSSQSTLTFFDAIKKHDQLVLDERSSKTSSGRNKFRVTIKPAN